MEYVLRSIWSNFVPVFMNWLGVVRLNLNLYALAFGVPIIFFFIAEACKILLAKTMKK